MIKHYCDCCGIEMSRTNQGPLSYSAASVANAAVQLTFSVTGVTTNGTTSADVCKYCLLDALETMDDRPASSRPQKMV